MAFAVALSFYYNAYHDDDNRAGAGQKNCLRTVHLLAAPFLTEASAASTVGALLESAPWLHAATKAVILGGPFNSC